LPPRFLDHLLKDCRDYHLLNDLVVIYRITEESVEFLRIGTHTKLFPPKLR
jgi:addiction module RelE/StbE family toxin